MCRALEFEQAICDIVDGDAIQAALAGGVDRLRKRCRGGTNEVNLSQQRGGDWRRVTWERGGPFGLDLETFAYISQHHACCAAAPPARLVCSPSESLSSAS